VIGVEFLQQFQPYFSGMMALEPHNNRQPASMKNLTELPITVVVQLPWLESLLKMGL